MNKVISIMIASIILLTTANIAVTADSSGDENYSDNSNEYAQGNQPDPYDIPGMNRQEDRTRNKDS